MNDRYENIRRALAMGPTQHEVRLMQSAGNSMAVPVMHWIGKRIELVEWVTN